MKTSFTERPDAWLRAHRVYRTPAEYGSAIQRFERKGHAAAAYVGALILAVLGYLLLTGMM